MNNMTTPSGQTQLTWTVCFPTTTWKAVCLGEKQYFSHSASFSAVPSISWCNTRSWWGLCTWGWRWGLVYAVSSIERYVYHWRYTSIIITISNLTGCLTQALKVNIQSMTENSGGLVLNLMANDVNRFDTGPLFAHYLWIGPFETMVGHNRH